MTHLARHAARRRRSALLNLAVAIVLGIIGAALALHPLLLPTGNGAMDLLAGLLGGLFLWGSGYSARHGLMLEGL